MMKNYIFDAKNWAYSSSNTYVNYLYSTMQMELAKEEKCEFLPFLSPHKVGVQYKKTIIVYVDALTGGY